MKIALCTMIDDKFKIGFDVMIKSFLKHNTWFDNDIVIIDVGLSESNKKEIKEKYNVIFKKPKKKNYSDVKFNKTHDKLKNTYYTLDIFSYTEYDRIVFIDSDVLIMKDIKDLFNCRDKIVGAKAYNAKLDVLRDDINSGVFVINKPLISDISYKRLLRIAQRGHSMPDQRTINTCFRTIMKFVNKSYNVEKRMFYSKRYRHIYDNAKILHFIAKKPWESGENYNEIENSFEKVEQLWWDFYHENID